MDEYSRIVIEHYCQTHKTKKAAAVAAAKAKYEEVTVTAKAKYDETVAKAQAVYDNAINRAETWQYGLRNFV